MMDFVREAGWGIWPVFAFGLVTVVSSVGYALGRRRPPVALAVGLGLATLLAGFLGSLTGIQTTCQAIRDGAPSEVIYVGLQESLNCLVAAFLLAGISTLAVTVGWYRRLCGQEPREVPG